MMRESDITQSCGMAAIGVQVDGTVYFAYRPRTGNSVTTVAGPVVTLPLYVRLVRSGDTITGYYSQTDPQTFTSLGSVTETNIMPSLYYVGFCAVSYTHLDVYKRQLFLLTGVLIGEKERDTAP